MILIQLSSFLFLNSSLVSSPSKLMDEKKESSVKLEVLAADDVTMYSMHECMSYIYPLKDFHHHLRCGRNPNGTIPCQNKRGIFFHIFLA